MQWRIAFAVDDVRVCHRSAQELRCGCLVAKGHHVKCSLATTAPDVQIHDLAPYERSHVSNASRCGLLQESLLLFPHGRIGHRHGRGALGNQARHSTHCLRVLHHKGNDNWRPPNFILRIQVRLEPEKRRGGIIDPMLSRAVAGDKMQGRPFVLFEAHPGVSVLLRQESPHPCESLEPRGLRSVNLLPLGCEDLQELPPVESPLCHVCLCHDFLPDGSKNPGAVQNQPDVIYGRANLFHVETRSVSFQRHVVQVVGIFQNPHNAIVDDHAQLVVLNGRTIGDHLHSPVGRAHLALPDAPVRYDNGRVRRVALGVDD
mmetsp:Transcript_4948/g.11034  ORF Transcript_4948/g.11034 Transcript_4948/m.11034 type:complete len:316 (+) Transcript_4948:1399-2346(+)